MKVVLSPNRDLPLMKFLWRWKLASTSALHKKFFDSLSSKTAYKRLWKLERAGFLKTYSDTDRTMLLWGLDKSGFKRIQEELPTLAQNCFRSEHVNHDYLATAFHIGELLTVKSGPIKVFSEQELRSFELHDYPSWVPRSKRHRPDGYWSVLHNSGLLTIAVEVELNRKSPEAYLTVRDFYDEHENINAAIWLCENESMSKWISEKVNQNKSKHSFIILSQFKKLGWDATLKFGILQGKSIRQAIVENPLQITWNVHSTRFLLDTRKTPFQTRPCKEVQPLRVID